MDQLLALVRGSHIGLALIVYPYPNEVFRQESTSLQVRFWRDWAGARGVPLFDLFPAFLSYRPGGGAIADNFIAHDGTGTRTATARLPRVCWQPDWQTPSEAISPQRGATPFEPPRLPW
jgi:hypothetical protein